MISKKFQMTKQDWKKFGEEALTKLTPYLLVLIPVMLEQLPKEASYTVVAVFILQRIQSFLKLWITEHKV